MHSDIIALYQSVTFLYIPSDIIQLDTQGEKMQYIQYYNSPISKLVMIGNQTSLTGLWFASQNNILRAMSEEYQEQSLPVFEETETWLDIYFSGKAPNFTPPLSIESTPFRKMVWELLLTIPYGTTMTYGQIAKIIMRKTGKNTMSAQAVGQAVGHNPISIIIPCHRVMGANGSLTGYAGGIDIKMKLLQLEHIIHTIP